MQNFEIEHFISLWDFLNKRFFFHLDGEHLNMCGVLKSDLLKYYLVNAVKTKSKEKVTEFFSMYSHEILAESGSSIPGNLRGWFVLPYMDEPDKDPEFNVFFSTRWADLLKVTLHNFLSVVLSTAPPPKLLLLERWFRSEAQQEIRSQLKLSSHKIDSLLSRLEKNEERMQAMREAVKELVAHVHKMSVSGPGERGGSATRASVGLFETDEEAESKRLRAKELGQATLKVAGECTRRSTLIDSMSRDVRLREILGRECASIFFRNADVDLPRDTEGGGGGDLLLASASSGPDMEDLEASLLGQLREWLRVLAK